MQSHMRVDQCVCAIRVVEIPVIACLSSRCSEVTEVGGMKFCENNSGGFHAKFCGNCGCNPDVPCRGMLNLST
jgi:hypothetical protein